MPHVEGEPQLIAEVHGCPLYIIHWKNEGQCVALTPAPKFRVELRGGVRIDVEAKSAHKGRKLALDILELLHDA